MFAKLQNVNSIVYSQAVIHPSNCALANKHFEIGALMSQPRVFPDCPTPLT